MGLSEPHAWKQIFVNDTDVTATANYGVDSGKQDVQCTERALTLGRRARFSAPQKRAFGGNQKNWCLILL